MTANTVGHKWINSLKNKTIIQSGLIYINARVDFWQATEGYG